jgi:hypothetical protein
MVGSLPAGSTVVFGKDAVSIDRVYADWTFDCVQLQATGRRVCLSGVGRAGKHLLSLANAYGEAVRLNNRSFVGLSVVADDAAGITSLSKSSWDAVKVTSGFGVYDTGTLSACNVTTKSNLVNN